MAFEIFGRKNRFITKSGGVILQSLDRLTNWKVPFDSISIHCLVKAYLNKKGDTVLCFRRNMLGNDWLHGFIKCHNLTKRITDNVKAARAAVNHEIINSCFDYLEQWLKDVPSTIYTTTMKQTYHMILGKIGNY